VLFLVSDELNPYNCGGFCFLSAPYFVRILSKFQAVRGLDGRALQNKERSIET